MKHVILGCGALALAAGATQAERLDRSGQSILPIFEPGNYAEVTFGSVNPSVSGGIGPLGSGNMTRRFWQASVAYKQQLTEAFSLGFIYDQPFGAHVDYPTGTGYPLEGTTARLRSNAFTLLGNYRFENGFGVHGGLRLLQQRASARVAVSPFYIYDVNGTSDEGFGYVVGVSYEKPEIALRVALTYNSEIKTRLPTTETVESVLGSSGPIHSTTPITTPQSVNLDFQTGVAPDTLLFGGIRWVDWSSYTIDPISYPDRCGAPLASADCGPLISYRDNSLTYTLGLGRQFTEAWSGSMAVTYEKNDSVTPASNLGPVSGSWGLTLGARYETGPYIVAGGLNYTWLGNVTTNIGEYSTRFDGNHAVGLGLKLAYRF